jgi:hypothetical protein
MAAQHRPAKIHLLAAPPVIWIVFPEGTDWATHSGIVDQQVDGAELLLYLLHHLPD